MWRSPFRDTRPVPLDELMPRDQLLEVIGKLPHGDSL
jgi:hypothetical protein